MFLPDVSALQAQFTHMVSLLETIARQQEYTNSLLAQMLSELKEQKYRTR